jgi:hypothetical protein
LKSPPFFQHACIQLLLEMNITLLTGNRIDETPFPAEQFLQTNIKIDTNQPKSTTKPTDIQTIEPNTQFFISDIIPAVNKILRKNMPFFTLFGGIMPKEQENTLWMRQIVDLVRTRSGLTINEYSG